VDILEDSSGVAIEHANSLHTIGFMKRDYTLLPEELEPTTETHDAYFLFQSKVDYPLTNAVWALDKNADFPDSQIKKIVDNFKKRNYAQAWWLGEHSTPANLENALTEYGLTRVVADIPMMAADLTHMDFSELDVLSETKLIQVKRVSTKEDLSKWLGVIHEVYQYPDEYIEALRYIFTARLKDGASSPAQNFLAEVERIPVGASSLSLCEGLAGLYYVCAKKEYRGQGIGTAVTLTAMKEGRVRGYEVGVLGASEMGYGVYQRVGFKEYFKLQIYGT
jgi:ribosomal protein S18 acetylase RimI-like enzyme